jgi:hypothetical protein
MPERAPVAAEVVVQAQLDAYNARDIEAFVACYADDVEVRDLDTGDLRMQGIAAFREAYAAQFMRWPGQRASIAAREVVGDYVMDIEHVRGVPERDDARLMALFRVREGRIDRVWFSPRVALP